MAFLHIAGAAYFTKELCTVKPVRFHTILMDKVIELLLTAKDEFISFFQRICFSYEEGDVGDEYAPSK